MTGIGEIGDEHYGNLNLVPLSIMKEYQLSKVKRSSNRLKGGDSNGTEEENKYWNMKVLNDSTAEITLYGSITGEGWFSESSS
ncbi:hypothetical protein PO124_35425, partial [Bacillus licheniformis]|nr:hypothetical protein [Bacillus licheniformis]